MAAGLLNDARFTMWATVVPRLVSPGQVVPTAGQTGAYKIVQDPDSGQMITVFDTDGAPTSAAGHVGGEASPYQIRCYARGYTALGYRSSANKKTYIGEDYQIVESIQFDFPKKVVLSHQSLITNIRSGEDPNTETYFMNEETGNPIVWEVQGVTPVHDPFGKWIRNTTVLKRAEIQ